MGTITDQDRGHLDRAAELAERGRGRVHPNPVVGCVLVRGEEVVGEGAHLEYGGAHAEVHALREAGGHAAGATAYVTLEPCAHEGKTPPCARALLGAGVARVVYGVADPGPGSGGAAFLRAHGIPVDGPVFAPARARRQNPAFLHVHATGTPYVALKLAMTLDGKIAAAPGRSTRITGEAAGARVHTLRREFDAVLVGRRTATVDDPLLTVRDGGPVPRPPARIVLDGSLGLSTDSRMLAEPGGPVVVFGAEDADPERRGALEDAGARVETVAAGPGGLDLDAVLLRLWDLELRAVLCEGGGRVASSLVRSGRIHRFYQFVAPHVLGPDAVPGFALEAGPEEWKGWTPLAPVETLGRDVLITWEPETP